MKYEITTFSSHGGDDIICTREDGRILRISYDLKNYPGKEEPNPITYGTIKHWYPPYEDEEITIEEKKEILELIDKKFNTSTNKKINIEYTQFSYKSFFSESDMVINILKGKIIEIEPGELPVLTISEEKDPKKWKPKKFIEITDSTKKNMAFPLEFIKYCELWQDELKKFKEEMNKKKEFQYKYLEFAKWKVKEGIEYTDQEYFNYGLYALEMVLCESTKEEVKEILKKYIELAKKKNLSFEPFMKRNRELNKMIEELK